MSTGEWLGVILGGFFLVWLTFDAVVWLRGKQTFSQWVIKESKKRLRFALGTFLVLVVACITLIVHFDLIPIIMEHLNG